MAPPRQGKISKQDQLFTGYFEGGRPIESGVSDVYTALADDWIEQDNIWTNSNLLLILAIRVSLRFGTILNILVHKLAIVSAMFNIR